MTYSNSVYSALALRLYLQFHILLHIGFFTRAWLLLISCHDNMFLFTELGNIVIIVTNPMFILGSLEKFTFKFTMSAVDGCAVYMHIDCLNGPE